MLKIENRVIKGLTESEKSVYKFLVDNKMKILTMSINEIASLTHVSPPTISRFIKKLGFQNLLEFRSYFYTLNKSEKKIKLVLNSDKIKEFLKTQRDNVGGFYDYFIQEKNISSIDNLLNNINYADNVVLVGKGTSLIPVVALENELVNLNKSVVNTQNTEILLQKLKRLSKKDLLIIFSVSSKSSYIKFILENIKNTESKVIMITSSKLPIKGAQSIYLPMATNITNVKLANNIIQLNFVGLISELLSMK